MSAMHAKPGAGNGGPQAPNLLDTLTALVILGNLLPERSAPARKNLYRSIETLTVELVHSMEARGIATDEPYLMAGRFLDDCRRVVESPAAKMPCQPGHQLEDLFSRLTPRGQPGSSASN